MSIDPFPEQHDLIAFFECEPVLADKDVPWFYNRLSFMLQRKEGQIVFEIEPGERILRFRWDKNDQSLVNLNVDRIKGIQLISEGKRESLVVTFENEILIPLRIQLKPSIFVLWGTDNEIKQN